LGSKTRLRLSLRENHLFAGGNKRTAVPVSAAFLRRNGYYLDFDAAAHQCLSELYERAVRELENSEQASALR
jgi:prophage maintenance system killer protein